MMIARCLFLQDCYWVLPDFPIIDRISANQEEALMMQPVQEMIIQDVEAVAEAVAVVEEEAVAVAAAALK